tara:strand:+ start:380 stop:1153 length:774 start_codon:yes stop_codon:yes gene_type:complete
MNKKYINHQIYNDPEFYNDIMWWKKDDIKFWKNIIKNTKSKKILELCCGTGRIGIPLIESGIDYYGIDISSSFIQFFQKSASQLKYNTSKIMCGDIKNFNLNQSFDLIFIGFNSLAHLLTNQDLLDALKNIKLHMHAQSIFAIDIFVPDSSFLYRKKKDQLNIMDFIHSKTNDTLNILESIDYNSSTEINHINWDFIDKDNISKFNYSFDMRMWFPDTLNRILIDSNYQIQKFYGDYQCNIFNEESEKQIYLCKKYI